jgi:hypothetical protein
MCNCDRSAPAFVSFSFSSLDCFPLSFSSAHHCAHCAANELRQVVKARGLHSVWFPFQRSVMIAAAPVALALALGKILTYISYGKVTLRLNCAAFGFQFRPSHVYSLRNTIYPTWLDLQTHKTFEFVLFIACASLLQQAKRFDALAVHVIAVGGGC